MLSLIFRLLMRGTSLIWSMMTIRPLSIYPTLINLAEKRQ